jgi:hypothetical protein
MALELIAGSVGWVLTMNELRDKLAAAPAVASAAFT